MRAGTVTYSANAPMRRKSGVDTPTIDDLIQLDRKRKGKKLSNEDWTSKTDPDAKIAKMKDGSTHLAYKPEHAVDFDTGVIVAAQIHEADQGEMLAMAMPRRVRGNTPDGPQQLTKAEAYARHAIELIPNLAKPGRPTSISPASPEDGAPD